MILVWIKRVTAALLLLLTLVAGCFLFASTVRYNADHHPEMLLATVLVDFILFVAFALGLTELLEWAGFDE